MRILIKVKKLSRPFASEFLGCLRRCWESDLIPQQEVFFDYPDASNIGSPICLDEANEEHSLLIMVYFGSDDDQRVAHGQMDKIMRSFQPDWKKKVIYLRFIPHNEVE